MLFYEEFVIIAETPDNVLYSMRIALQQLDHLGDVILTFPMAALLKAHYPQAEVIMIARESARALVDLCADIDEFYAGSDDEQEAATHIQNLQQLRLDALIHVGGSNRPILKWAKAAKIPIRVGNWRRFYHIKTCNRLVYAKREQVQANEAMLNAKLLQALNIHQTLSFQELNAKIRLKSLPHKSPKVAFLLDPRRFNLVLHPGSSAQHAASKEWPESYYLQLLDQLDPLKFKILVTGTLGTENLRFQNLLEDTRVHNLMGQLSVRELIQLLQGADGLLCGSTGPLHISGLLNKRCLGLYLPHPSKNHVRWGPFGTISETITAQKCAHCKTTMKPREDACQCMYNISPEEVAAKINAWC